MGRIQLTAPPAPVKRDWMTATEVADYLRVGAYRLTRQKRRDREVAAGKLPAPHPTHRGERGVPLWQRAVVEAFEPAE